jgi:hypothetical protein
MYVVSDSLIALAAFVLPGNVVVAWLDHFAWPIYWAGQVALTVGALNSFSDMELNPVPKSSSSGNTLLNLAAAAAFFVALRRLLWN